MGLVEQAQVHYADAIAVLLHNGIYSSDELRDLELEIVRAADLVRQQNALDPRSTQIGTRRMDRIGLASGSYLPSGAWVPNQHELREQTNTLWDLAGLESSEEAKQRRHRVDHMTSQYGLARESYRRLIDYAETVSESAPADEPAWRSRLETYLQLADWDLVYSANGAALDEYAQVHEMLEATDLAEPLIAEIFVDRLADVPAEPTADADISSLHRRGLRNHEVGEGRRVEILGPNIPDAAKEELVGLGVADGEFAVRRRSVRYYLND